MSSSQRKLFNLTETIIVRITDENYTKDLIKFWTEGDITQLSVSLNCPVTKTRLKVPCRGEDCTHVQCFDGLTFLKMNERMFGKWLCNICHKPSPLNKLMVDGLISDILKTVPEDVTEIYFDENRNWYSTSTDKTSSELDCSVIDLCQTMEEVIDLTGSDDEEITKSKETDSESRETDSQSSPHEKVEKTGGKKCKNEGKDHEKTEYKINNNVYSDNNQTDGNEKRQHDSQIKGQKYGKEKGQNDSEEKRQNDGKERRQKEDKNSNDNLYCNYFNTNKENYGYTGTSYSKSRRIPYRNNKKSALPYHRQKPGGKQILSRPWLFHSNCQSNSFTTRQPLHQYNDNYYEVNADIHQRLENCQPMTFVMAPFLKFLEINIGNP